MSIALTTKVVGLTFNSEYPSNVYEIAKRFALGDDSISIEREPDNEFDNNAIVVVDGEKAVGHLPAKIAALIAPQIDAGVSWFAAIESVVISQENVNQPGLKVTIWSTDDE